MKTLFICSANKQRSKTAEDYFSEQYPEQEFHSAGTNFKICFQEGTEPVSEELLEWADVVQVMEKRHKDFILRTFGSTLKSKITILHIPDHYKYFQKELLDLLDQKCDF